MATGIEAIFLTAADEVFRFTFPGMTLKIWNKFFFGYPQNPKITTDTSNDDYQHGEWATNETPWIRYRDSAHIGE